MTLLYLAYGVALFALGFASLIYPTDSSNIPLARHIRLLGAFGVIHATVEWLHALQSSGAVNAAEVAPLRSLLLVVTFALLLQFAIGVLGVRWPWRFVPLALAASCFALGLTGGAHSMRTATAARYLLGMPGSALAALAMFRQAKSLSARPRRYAFRLRLLGTCFMIYALTAGLVVSDEDASFFPASMFNEATFAATLLVPVQAVRLCVAALGAYATVALLELFRHEAVQALRAARDHLEARVAERTSVLEGVNRDLAREIAERKSLEAKLVFADRMAAIGTLAAGMAHEVNNPLAYSMLNLEIVDKQLDLLARWFDARASDEEQNAVLREAKESVSQSLEGARRIRDIVLQLKQFARKEDGIVHGVDVREPLRFAMAVANNEIKHRAKLKVELGNVELVDANPGRLGQVFLNLLINAAQAIPADSRDEKLIRVLTGTEGDVVFVEVDDSGEGISEESLKKIFDPFFTTRAVGAGTGLGLWICHTIVSDLGGRIVVRSELGKGSSFRVELPASERGAQAGDEGTVA